MNGNGATTSANGASSLGRSFSSTTDLAAAAAQATGLGFHSKRKREDSPTKPSPITVVRVKEEDYYDFDGGKPTTNGGSRNNSSKPWAPSLLRARALGSKQPPSPAPTYETVPPAVRRRRRTPPVELPRWKRPMTTSRVVCTRTQLRPHASLPQPTQHSCAQETMAEDPVHGQDPGILPSCWAMYTVANEGCAVRVHMRVSVGGVSSELYGYYEGQGGRVGGRVRQAEG